MSSEDQIIVNTKEIEKQADALTKELSALEQCVKAMQQISRGTSSFWTGEAGEVFRQLAGESVRDANEAITELKKYPSRLEEAAGIFGKIEQKSEDQNGKLPVDLFD